MNLQTLADMPPWEWPTNADEVISKVLREKDTAVSDLILAVEMAGSEVVMNDNIAALLLTVVRDSGGSEELRCKAAISLGPALEHGDTMEFDDPDDLILSEEKFNEVREALRDIYQDGGTPKTVRRKVLEAAVRAPMDWHKEAIQTAYESNDEEWILTAVFCMGYVEGFEEQILESFASKNPDIYYEAVCSAGNREIEAAWPYIEGLITGEEIDKSLLIAAIDAAAHINPSEALEILTDYSYSNDEEIAEAAEDALTMATLISGDLPEDEDYY